MPALQSTAKSSINRMELQDKLSALRSTAKEQLSLLNSKRKSENALLLPFFGLLEYHPFDVREVDPDYVVELDAGRERTVDYVLKKGGTPAIFVESREIGTDLNACDPGSLLRLLKKSEAPVGALTDGIEYHFYADLESFYSVLEGTSAPDTRPFLTFDIFHPKDSEVRELRRLSRSEFDADGVLSYAHQLKYKRLFRAYLSEQVDEPDEAFVRFLTEQVHEGKASEDVGMYKSCAREAVRELFGDVEEGGNQNSTQRETEEVDDGERLIQNGKGLGGNGKSGESEVASVFENHFEPHLEMDVRDK